MKTIKQILIEARALIATPDRWTSRAFARDENNEPTDVFGEYATCFCTIGAIYHAAGECKDERLAREYNAVPALSALEKANNLFAIANYNDESGRSHADILQLFDKAIAAQVGNESDEAFVWCVAFVRRCKRDPVFQAKLYSAFDGSQARIAYHTYQLCEPWQKQYLLNIDSSPL